MVAGQFSVLVPSQLMEFGEILFLTPFFFPLKAKWGVLLLAYLINLSVFQNNHRQFIFFCQNISFQNYWNEILWFCFPSACLCLEIPCQFIERNAGSEMMHFPLLHQPRQIEPETQHFPPP